MLENGGQGMRRAVVLLWGRKRMYTTVDKLTLGDNGYAKFNPHSRQLGESTDRCGDWRCGFGVCLWTMACKNVRKSSCLKKTSIKSSGKD